MSQPFCQVRILTPEEGRFTRLRALLAAADKNIVNARCRWLASAEVAQHDDGNVFLVDHEPSAGLDGLAVIARLRARGCRQAVVLLLRSADADETDCLEAAQAAGASDCLPDARADAFVLPRVVRAACEAASAAERKELLRALAEPRDEAYLLRMMTDKLSMAVGRIDAEGRLLSLTGHLLEELGVAARQIVGGKACHLFHDAGGCVQKALTGESVDFPSVASSPRGERHLHNYLFHDSGRGEGAICVIRDVTERVRAAEHALAESRQQFQTLLERSLDAILLVDDDGVCIEANQAACGLLGYGRAQLVGRCAEEIGFGGFAPLRPDALHRTPFQGATQPFDWSYQRPDGEGRAVEFAAYRASPHFHLCILRDRTEQRRLEREILEVIDQERQRFGQDLHDDLGQHLAGVSYMGEALAVRLAARHAPEAEDAAEIARLIHGAMGQARDIASGLYPIAGHLPDMLRQLCRNFCNAYRTDCSYEEDTDPALPPLDGGAALQLFRIAQEAANNAHRHGRARRVGIRLVHRDGGVTLSVEDDGKGFDSASSPPASGREEGRRGLGLHMMKYRATLLGGTLAVGPGEDGGTRVTCAFDLPLHRPAAA